MTPKGTRLKQIKLREGDAVHVYCQAGRIVLQLRRNVQTEVEILQPSFKVAVELSPAEAVAIRCRLVLFEREIPGRGNHGKAKSEAKRKSRP